MGVDKDEIDEAAQELWDLLVEKPVADNARPIVIWNGR